MPPREAKTAQPSHFSPLQRHALHSRGFHIRLVFAATEIVIGITEISLCGEYKQIKDFPRVASHQHPWGNISQTLDTRDTLRAQPSTSPSKIVEDSMLAKCANPACSAPFRYLHEGKLFATQSKADSLKRGPPADLEYTVRSHTHEYFWLCSSCCCAMTVQSNGDHGITLVPKQGVLPTVSVVEDAQIAT